MLIQNGIDTLINNGLVELLIFAIIFAVTYGVLGQAQIFGGDNNSEAKKYHMIIALAFGALSIVPHFVSPGSSYDIVPMIEKALPQTMLLLLFGLCVMIVLGLFGFEGIMGESSWGKPIAAIVLVGVIIYIFGGASGVAWRLPYWFSSDLIAALLALAAFAVVVYAVTKGDGEEKS